jgi:hypothetical protein
VILRVRKWTRKRLGGLARASLLTAAWVAAAFASADTGTIYRCDGDDGSIVFSDRPCSERSEPIEASSVGGTFSVVRPAGSLGSAAESNARFLDRRRAERSDRIRAEREAREEERLQRRAVPPMVVPIPVYVDPRSSDALTSDRPATARARLEALQQNGGRSRSATDERRDARSALSGRQLGARRNDEDG